MPAVLIFPQMYSREYSYGYPSWTKRSGIRRGLNVINAPRVVVVTSCQRHAQAFSHTQPLRHGPIKLRELTPVNDGRISINSRHRIIRLIIRHSSYQVDRAAYGVSILIRGQRLAQFNGLHQNCRNNVQFNDAHIALGRSDTYTVNGQIAEPRFRTTNLDILTL